AAHLILALDQNLAHFLVQPVFDGQLLQHALADARGHHVPRLDLNLAALHQPFHHFTGHVGHKIPNEQHLRAFPWGKCKQISLLAAPRKCNKTRGRRGRTEGEQKIPELAKQGDGQGDGLRVDPSRCFRYDEFHGRLAQRLERSVYTRKVVRSNRTVPTILKPPSHRVGQIQAYARLRFCGGTVSATRCSSPVHHHRVKFISGIHWSKI